MGRKMIEKGEELQESMLECIEEKKDVLVERLERRRSSRTSSSSIGPCVAMKDGAIVDVVKVKGMELHVEEDDVSTQASESPSSTASPATQATSSTAPEKRNSISSRLSAMLGKGSSSSVRL
eukprot:gnl/TRDRNA2_/TRDRNA2_188218_c0_seq1.p2 gnl/TRDRNA2_/TRDRNA2_188218_c0~~gnl/TRDRNA2_/TRDRNA2_188218_c0_seq1.p2  ORF type:complete len:122 (+),score=34.45 gnl/TRDRNA2_/TRDRNA2_188218_c0_seq1:179-544(+)